MLEISSFWIHWMWIELKIVISYPKTVKMSTSIDREFLARATIALFAPRPMLDHQQKFLLISAARMLLCSSLVHFVPEIKVKRTVYFCIGRLRKHTTRSNLR